MGLASQPPAVTVTLVVAMDLAGVIGRGNELPWQLPADLRHFRRVTMGKAIVMGRLTHESIGRALPGRRNLVISRQGGLELPGCEVVSSLDAALDLVAGPASREAMIIGGATIYRLALPRAHRMHLTRVQAHCHGDVRFPSWDPAEWRQVACQEHPADAQHAHPFTFLELERRAARP